MPFMGVTLTDFTEWTLPYILLQDDGQDVGNWGWLVRVGHTRELARWEGRLVQQLVHKPFQMKQRYVHEDKAGL